MRQSLELSWSDLSVPDFIVTLKHLGSSQNYTSRMDPYLKVKLGTLTLTTKVHKDAGKNPQWNDVSLSLHSLDSNV